MRKIPISTIILTHNEEKRIKDCLDSVSGWSNETIVVDSGSSDKTVEIAKSSTDKIYKHSFENYAKQRNWAQKNIPLKNEWIFHLDADERVSQPLASELNKIFSSEINIDGFMIPRKTIFRGRWIRYGGHYPVYHLRIFKTKSGKCEERLYDQHFTVNGKTAKLEGDIINIIEPNLKIFKNKHKKWTRLEAQQVLTEYACPPKPWRRRRIRPSAVAKHNKYLAKAENTEYGSTPIEKRKWLKKNIYYKMPPFIRPVLYFLYRYIFRLGFLDGKEGFIFHLFQGLWFRWLIDCEVFRLRRNK